MSYSEELCRHWKTNRRLNLHCGCITSGTLVYVEDDDVNWDKYHRCTIQQELNCTNVELNEQTSKETILTYNNRHSYFHTVYSRFKSPRFDPTINYLPPKLKFKTHHLGKLGVEKI